MALLSPRQQSHGTAETKLSPLSGAVAERVLGNVGFGGSSSAGPATGQQRGAAACPTCLTQEELCEELCLLTACRTCLLLLSQLRDGLKDMCSLSKLLLYESQKNSLSFHV